MVCGRRRDRTRRSGQLRRRRHEQRAVLDPHSPVGREVLSRQGRRLRRMDLQNAQAARQNPRTEIMSRYDGRHVYIDGGWTASAVDLIEVDSAITGEIIGTIPDGT